MHSDLSSGKLPDFLYGYNPTVNIDHCCHPGYIYACTHMNVTLMARAWDLGLRC